MHNDGWADSSNSTPNKLMLGGILVLVLVIVICSYLNRNNEGLQEGTVIISAENSELGRFSVNDLQQLPAVEKKMTVHSSQGDSEHDYVGTPLLAVLNKIDPVLPKEYSRVMSRGIDNYTSGLYMSEVLQPDNVYIVYSDFGKSLPTKNGGEGSIQIIICNDDYGQRFTKWLVSLELQK